MSINKLYVEGKLDQEIYVAAFGDVVTITTGGSKNALRPKARSDREDGIQAGYLRDRDFDFAPPQEMETATVDAADDSVAFGWRLNRNEIENYLIDPKVVAASGLATSTHWEAALLQASRTVCWYQVARWTIGEVRSKLPPNYRLQTSSEKREYQLPNDLSQTACLQWCRTRIGEFREQLADSLDEAAVTKNIQKHQGNLFSETRQQSAEVLRWFSGKDLLVGAVADQTVNPANLGTKSYLARLRDWVIAHSEEFVEMIPELQSLRQQMSGS